MPLDDHNGMREKMHERKRGKGCFLDPSAPAEEPVALPKVAHFLTIEAEKLFHDDFSKMLKEQKLLDLSPRTVDAMKQASLATMLDQLPVEVLEDLPLFDQSITEVSVNKLTEAEKNILRDRDIYAAIVVKRITCVDIKLLLARGRQDALILNKSRLLRDEIQVSDLLRLKDSPKS